MDDNTSTDQPAVAAAVEQTPPAEATAESVSPESTTTTEPSDAPEASETAAPTPDDQLRKFAASQGIELDSPNAIKAAQALQKARSEATKNYQRASELEKSAEITQDQLPSDASSQDVDNARVRNLEMKMEIQSWKFQNQDKLELEPEMVKILSDPNKKAMVQQGYLSLDDVYKLAKAEAPDNSALVKSQGKQEALQSLAHKQQAAVPTGHATVSGTTPKEKPFSELTREEMRARLGVHKR